MRRGGVVAPICNNNNVLCIYKKSKVILLLGHAAPRFRGLVTQKAFLFGTCTGSGSDGIIMCKLELVMPKKRVRCNLVILALRIGGALLFFPWHLTFAPAPPPALFPWVCLRARACELPLFLPSPHYLYIYAPYLFQIIFLILQACDASLLYEFFDDVHCDFDAFHRIIQFFVRN